MDDLTPPIDPAIVETLGEDLAWQSLVKSAEMAPTATVVRAMRDYAEHRCADAVKAAEERGAAAVREAIEKELDFAEDHARHVVDDEPLVATGLIRAALTAALAERDAARAEVVRLRADHRIVHVSGHEAVCACGAVVSVYGLTRSIASVFGEHIHRALAATEAAST